MKLIMLKDALNRVVKRYTRKRKTPNKKKVSPIVDEVVDIQIERCSEANNSTTPSASKVETIDIEQNDVSGCYIFMDMGILEMMFSCLVCSECFRQEINIEDINSKKKGLVRYLPLKCSTCGFVRHFYSSKTVESDRGMKLFDVNVRTVY